MADFRRRSARLAVSLAVATLALVEGLSLLQTLRLRELTRDRLLRSSRQALQRGRPAIAAALAPGGSEAVAAAAAEARRLTLCTEVELFDAAGRRLLAVPSPAPFDHWPSQAEREALERGELLALGPFQGARIATYARLPSASSALLLRTSTEAPELAEEMRERRQLLVAHAVALVALALAALLVLLSWGEEREAAPPGALGAYEEAMARLHQRDQALVQRHEVERRRLEEEVQDKQAMARAGELTAGIVHEVRNGLATILGYARMIEREAAGAAAAEPARAIREECETLEVVVRRFVDFVRHETLQLARFDLVRMLNRVAARESRSRPGATVEGLEGLLELTGDEDMLERAFENLVRNARDAAGEEGHVWVGLEREDGIAVVTVADDGPGLPSEGREGRPFFTTKPGGLGLGLPIAFKLVRLHGGEMSLADRLPTGLVVTVRLPLSPRIESPDEGGHTKRNEPKPDGA